MAALWSALPAAAQPPSNTEVAGTLREFAVRLAAPARALTTDPGR